MVDYLNQKVPDLKKILQERGLVISGNKADLVARLQEDDKKSKGAAVVEDEIDWDEDDNKASSASAATAVATGAQGEASNPPSALNQKVDTDPVATTDLKAIGGESTTENADKAVAEPRATTIEKPAEPEVPKQNFSMGIGQTDAEKEAEKRAVRAKRFGIAEDDEAKKLADRAKKFGVETNDAVVKGLDSALPDRRAKRAREDKPGGRSAKRQTPDRRTEPKPKAAAAVAKKPAGKVIDDPSEKAKAEARAKRFAAA